MLIIKNGGCGIDLGDIAENAIRSVEKIERLMQRADLHMAKVDVAMENVNDARNQGRLSIDRWLELRERVLKCRDYLDDLD